MTLATGRSQSLNRTIAELMRFLKYKGNRPNCEFRAFLHEKLADFGEHWYKRGVRRGHMESYRIFAETGELPRKLRYKSCREFFDGQERRISIRSKVNTVASRGLCQERARKSTMLYRR
jgi:hypothetical protein